MVTDTDRNSLRKKGLTSSVQAQSVVPGRSKQKKWEAAAPISSMVTFIFYIPGPPTTFKMGLSSSLGVIVIILTGISRGPSLRRF